MTALGLLLCSVACVFLLHIVRSDLGPIAHRLSEYANGPHGYLMTAAFVALGLGMVALGLALLSTSDTSAWRWLVPISVVAAGLGMVVSGIFRTDPLGTNTAAESIHSRASAFGSAALIGSAFAWSVVRQRRPPWRGRDGGAVLATLAVAIGGLSPVLHESRWTGLSQRVLWATLLSWLLLTSWRLTQPRAVVATDGRRNAVTARS